MSYALPFATKEYQPSSSEGGAVPTALLGQVFYDNENGNLLQIVKNTDESALAGCLAVKWETATGFEVDRSDTVEALAVAGVVHPDYANVGVTVPVNAAFWVVKRGPTYCIAGAVTTVGARLETFTGATALQGRIQDADSAAVILGADWGVVYESGNAGDSVFAMIDIP